jgi:DNA repair protein RadA/Sms
VAKQKTEFKCSECGWTTVKWAGRCGECQAWGSLDETSGTTKEVRALKLNESQAARPITEIETGENQSQPTMVGEFDRVLGGGLVPGAAILLSGEPGVGKSTLLLEVASRLAKQGKKVLYVSAEESASQVKLRAQRTNAMSPNLYLAAETDLATVLGQVEAIRPELFIVDSVQTMTGGHTDGVVGGVTQVRAVTTALTAAGIITLTSAGGGSA